MKKQYFSSLSFSFLLQIPHKSMIQTHLKGMFVCSDLSIGFKYISKGAYIIRLVRIFVVRVKICVGYEACLFTRFEHGI